MAMEIQVISRIGGFEAGINHLQNPSFISSLFHLSGIEKTSATYSFLTWGALIFAFLATFSSVIRRTKLIIFKLCKSSKSVNSESLLRPLIDYVEEDESCSLSSKDDEDENELSSPLENQRSEVEDFRVAGSGNHSNIKSKLRQCCTSEDRCFSWSDYADGKNVVKLWDEFGLGLGFENQLGSVIPIWDLNKEEIVTSFFGGRHQIPAVWMTSPAVIVSAGLENSRNVGIRVWDSRVGRQIPAVYAEWEGGRRKIVGINSGEVEKVYVRDDSSGLTVRDMRKVGVDLPLGDSTASAGEAWWDADAVIVEDDCDGCF